MLETNTWLNLHPGRVLDGHCDHGKENILDDTLQSTVQYCMRNSCQQVSYMTLNSTSHPSIQGISQPTA